MKTKTVVTVLLVLGLVLAGLGWFPGLDTDHESLQVQGIDDAGQASKAQGDKATSARVVIPDLTERQSQSPEPDDYIRQMVVLIQKEFGATISAVHVQVGLKAFRDDLIRNYPGEGAAMFEQIIRTAFPEYADQILAAIALMEEYENWLLEVMPELNQLDLAAQQDMLWEKRLALFGEDARLIWQRELSAEQERNESVRKTVAMLDTAYDLPMDERLYLLQNTFDEHYAQSMSELVYDIASVMTQVFFRFDSVQRDLAAMEPDARQETINDIRRKIGYSENQIASLAEQDQKKEARWQNGYAYMEERRALMQKDLSDQERQAQLAQLRQRYFGPEAHTISKEEEDLGFFRYERPRVYGWN